MVHIDSLYLLGQLAIRKSDMGDAAAARAAYDGMMAATAKLKKAELAGSQTMSFADCYLKFTQAGIALVQRDASTARRAALRALSTIRYWMGQIDSPSGQEGAGGRSPAPSGFLLRLVERGICEPRAVAARMLSPFNSITRTTSAAAGGTASQPLKHDDILDFEPLHERNGTDRETADGGFHYDYVSSAFSFDITPAGKVQLIGSSRRRPDPAGAGSAGVR